jgi:hypothetical protein
LLIRLQAAFEAREELAGEAADSLWFFVFSPWFPFIESRQSGVNQPKPVQLA